MADFSKRLKALELDVARRSRAGCPHRRQKYLIDRAVRHSDPHAIQELSRHRGDDSDVTSEKLGPPQRAAIAADLRADC